MGIERISLIEGRPSDVDRRINELLNDGWQLHGHMYQYVPAGLKHPVFVQPMITPTQKKQQADDSILKQLWCDRYLIAIHEGASDNVAFSRAEDAVESYNEQFGIK